MVVEFLYLHFPGDLVAFGVVLESDRKISSLVEFAERSRLRRPLVVSTGLRRVRHLVEAKKGGEGGGGRIGRYEQVGG